jgi:hypothetical protein
MATLGDEVLLSGDHTWTFDGTTWTQVSVTTYASGSGSLATLP